MDLLLSGFPSSTLEDVARNVFAAFGIWEFEERFNSHYVDDHYFVGHHEDITVKVMLTDDEEHADLPFWIHLETTASAQKARFS